MLIGHMTPDTFWLRSFTGEGLWPEDFHWQGLKHLVSHIGHVISLSHEGKSQRGRGVGGDTEVAHQPFTLLQNAHRPEHGIPS